MSKIMGRAPALLLVLLCVARVDAAGESAPVALRFGVVPQQSATVLARTWVPLLDAIAKRSGVALRFATAPDIPTFEQRLASGEYDIAYMNPYHYTVFSRRPGYRAFAHERGRRLKGILVVRADSGYSELAGFAGATLAFPAPAAFAASVLIRAAFERAGVLIGAKYVSSHDSVYRSVAAGLYPAGGGVVRTFENMPAEVRDQLRILWTTPDYTPHAIAARPSVGADTVSALVEAMVGLANDTAGRAVLEPVGFKGIDAAQDSDWDDVRALGLELLDTLVAEPQ